MGTVLDPAQVSSTPLRNGAGMTRTLASSDAPDGGVLWQISVADLDNVARFSIAPDLNRLLVPLGPILLTVDGAERACGAGDQVRFAGASAVRVQPAAPTRALNVMTRRGRYRAEVSLRSRGTQRRGPVVPEFTVLLGALEADVHLACLAEEFHD